jgi:hypothetical protein
MFRGKLETLAACSSFLGNANDYDDVHAGRNSIVPSWQQGTLEPHISQPSLDEILRPTLPMWKTTQWPVT